MFSVNDAIAIVTGSIFPCERHNSITETLLSCLFDRDAAPVAGTPVYCKLGGVVEHTGIYLGNGKIAHLNGNGNIEAVSPKEFCSRLGGFNPTRTIYFAQSCGRALGSRSVAERALKQIGSKRKYNVVFNNCHMFTCGCLSGDFENPCSFFWMVMVEIGSLLGSFIWQKWNY